jgi:hypothetical protein
MTTRYDADQYIWEGASVAKRQAGAGDRGTRRQPEQASSLWLTPKAAAIGASSAVARIALPRSVAQYRPHRQRGGAGNRE